jgi:hypothetical protein
MNRRDSSIAAADIVTWAASCLLTALVGVGISFGLWSRLHAAGATPIVYAALVALAIGAVLVGLALQRLLARVCVMILGFSVLLAYLLGPPGFSRLIGP